MVSLSSHLIYWYSKPEHGECFSSPCIHGTVESESFAGDTIELALFPGRSHRQYFIASSHTGSDEILAVGTAWERGYHSIRGEIMTTSKMFTVHGACHVILMHGEHCFNSSHYGFHPEFR